MATQKEKKYVAIHCPKLIAMYEKLGITGLSKIFSDILHTALDFQKAVSKKDMQGYKDGDDY